MRSYTLDRILEWLHRELITAPLRPVLHPSGLRLQGLGMLAVLGHPLLFCVWAFWLTQPYENFWLRATAAGLGCLLVHPQIARQPASELTARVFTAVMWFELPFFCSWMYLCNGGNSVWLAAVCTMVAIYYCVTDWRIASAGLIVGGFLAWLVFQWLGPATATLTDQQMLTNGMMMALAVVVGLFLGLSSVNLRRERLSNTLSTMSIMAHELRTPLSTVALLGDAIQLEVRRQPDNPRTPQIEKLALRLHVLVRNINRQIDMQIANAKLQQLTRHTERVSAANLVRDAVAAYPYASSRQRECVNVLISQGFMFRASSRQFALVLDNLMKNAFHSLMAADSKYPLGALRIEVKQDQGRGFITVVDEGMGIDSDLLPYIFKPFISSKIETSHGLGLAFCRKVVQSAGGEIRVKSEYAVGAAFIIELPVLQDQ